MNRQEKERLELDFARKTFDTIPTEEMREKVRELEESLDRRLGIWDDEETHQRLQVINGLNLSDKRLLLVFSILGGSVAKTASYFNCNRRTVNAAIAKIKEEIGLA